MLETLKTIILDFDSFDKLYGKVADAAKSIVDLKTSLVDILKQIGLNYLFINCIILQETFCGMFVETNETIKKIIVVLNSIRSYNESTEYLLPF